MSLNKYLLCKARAIYTDFCTFVIISTDDMSHFPEQFRARFILEYPTAAGVQCPQLAETRPCTSLPRCVHYHWQVSTWSTCMFADVTDHCGDDGYRIRGTSVYYY